MEYGDGGASDVHQVVGSAYRRRRRNPGGGAMGHGLDPVARVEKVVAAGGGAMMLDDLASKSLPSPPHGAKIPVKAKEGGYHR